MAGSCLRCNDPMPDDAPGWKTYCTRCFIQSKREQEQAVLLRALEAESRVELAKTVVLQLQAQIRGLQGELRAAHGKVGLQQPQAAPAAGGFTREELEWLRRRAHPDRNPESPMATALTQKLNALLDE